MTTPALAVPIRGRGRHYIFPPADPSQWPRNRWGSLDPESLPEGYEFYPSVTNVLSVIDKPALKFWAAEMAIRELYDAGFPPNVEDAVRAHKFACNRAAGKRADAGTRAHSIAEALTADLPLPASLSEEDEAYADAFMAFWTDHEPEVIATEATLYGNGYAGTADANLRIGGEGTLVDYKTRGERDESKIARYGLLYDGNRMQLAALARAGQMADPDGEGGWSLHYSPPVVQAKGVVLFPDGTYLIETLYVPEIGRWYSAFQGALQLWRGLNEDPS